MTLVVTTNMRSMKMSLRKLLLWEAVAIEFAVNAGVDVALGGMVGAKEVVVGQMRVYQSFYSRFIVNYRRKSTGKWIKLPGNAHI